jgi:membrane associated rhomboid family serine protease
MKIFWQRFTAALTPGVRILLGLLTLVYLAALIGKLASVFDLYHWLAASAPDFWHGQLWRILTYALLPTGIMDFAMNVIALILIGSLLERHWTRGELWRFCAFAASGAGFVQVVLSSASMTGAAPMMFGLLAAWAFAAGHETLLFPIFGQLNVRKTVLIFAGISLSVMFFTAGLVPALVMLAGGLTGWFYLWLRHKWLMTRPGHAVESGRINRLEL